MVRNHFSLHGDWSIAFDPGNRGKQEGWQSGSLSGGQPITVPGVWNLLRPGYEGVAWYLRRFRVPAEFRGEVVRLRFGAANYFAEVWLNGRYLGSHEGGYTPFEFDATKAIDLKGENLLHVRVVDPPLDDREIEGMIFSQIPNGKESWHFNFSGLWQSVELVASDDPWLRDCFVEPDVGASRACVNLEIRSRESRSVECRLTARPRQGGAPEADETFSLDLEVGKNKFCLPLPMTGATLWSTGNPFLYVLMATLEADSRLTDSLEVAFGMREFTVRENRFCLNGEPIHLKGILEQQFYPGTLAYPADERAARRTIEVAKEAGANFIRMHGRPAWPGVLDLADEEGVLIYQEDAIGWIVDSAHLRRRCQTEVAEMIRRDRNHPSVVIWGILNETGRRGTPDIEGGGLFYAPTPGVQAIKSELCLLARSLDPTRVIVDDSGGSAWSGEKTRYMPPCSQEFVEYHDQHAYTPAPVPQEGTSYWRELGSGKELLFVSEMGCAGLPDFPQMLRHYQESAPDWAPWFGDAAQVGASLEGRVSLLEDYRLYADILGQLEEKYRLYGMDRVFPSLSAMCRESQKIQAKGLERQVGALLTNPNCSGYFVTQLDDAASECNAGVADVFRQPKAAVEVLRRVHSPFKAFLFLERRNVFCGEEVGFEAVLVNEEGRGGTAELSLSAEGPGGRELWAMKEKVELGHGVHAMFKGAFPAGDEEGAGTLRLQIDPPPPHVAQGFSPADGGALEEDPFWVYRKEEAPRAALVDFRGVLAPFVDSADGHVTVIAPLETMEEVESEEVRGALERASAGGSAIFLGLPWDAGTAMPRPCWCSPGLFRSEALGLDIEFIASVSSFIGWFHYAHAHPIFRGLPSNCFLNEEYAEVMPRFSLRVAQGFSPALADLKVCATPKEGPQTIAGAFRTPVTYHTRVKRCPNADQVWWGSDVLLLPFGKGHLIFSQFRIADNLDKDPVSHRLLSNMVAFAKSL